MKSEAKVDDFLLSDKAKFEFNLSDTTIFTLSTILCCLIYI